VQGRNVFRGRLFCKRVAPLHAPLVLAARRPLEFGHSELARMARGQRPHSYQPRATPWEKASDFSLRANGLSHIHVPVQNPSQADLIERIKTSSSAWNKKHGVAHRRFFWQRGYGASSVGFSQLDSLIHYIDTQEEHHRTKAFQEEYRELLRKYHIEFDECYVWD
jgi:hypothetical protein